VYLIYVIQDNDHLWAVVNMVMNFRGPYMAMNFFKFSCVALHVAILQYSLTYLLRSQTSFNQWTVEVKDP